MTKTEFIDMIVKNHNTNKWLNCTESVTINENEVAHIGVKAFGKDLQILQLNGIYGGTCMGLKTVKAFCLAVETEVNGLLTVNGYKCNSL